MSCIYTASNTSVRAVILAEGASSFTDHYKGWTLNITAGIGNGQSATISAYDGTSRIVEFTADLTTGVGAGAEYSLVGLEATGVSGQITFVSAVGGTFSASPTTTTGEYNVCYAPIQAGPYTPLTVAGGATWNTRVCVPPTPPTTDGDCCTHCSSGGVYVAGTGTPSTCDGVASVFKLSSAGACVRVDLPYWVSDGDADQETPPPETIVIAGSVAVLR